MEPKTLSSDVPVLSCSSISKTYSDGQGVLSVLNNINFSIHQSERVAIVGASGSGKSSLLHILGGLDKPSKGEVTLNQVALLDCNQQKQAELRNKHLGFVYQFHHLLAEFTALENVAMPQRIAGIKAKQAMGVAQDALALVGLTDRASHKPNALSGGERQRVAIARAIVNKPKVLLADEPTGNLDAKTGEQIFQLLLSLQQQTNMALVIVTHDNKLADKMHRTLTLVNGKLEAL
jgi:lipoprotein-releasing system ATP-binding protein